MKSDNTPEALRRRRSLVEALASVGMLLIGAGMLLPLFNLLDTEKLSIYRWIFAAGSLIFWASRCVPVSAPDESTRLRRLRRMEFWSGACFGVATFFWFYNESRYGNLPYVGSLMILRDTILFALAGAAIQLAASWMIYLRQKKDAREQQGAAPGKKTSEKKKNKREKGE